MLATAVGAQNVTLGSLSGVVKDAQGGVLPGATVVAVHTPTGTTYEGTTEADGRFALVNVRVGGPYEITVAMPSFRSQVLSGITVTLGSASDVAVTLQLETLTETVQVVASASSVFSPAKTGTTENVSQAAIENLPTISRSLTDFARTSPFFVQNTTNANTDSALSVAGRSSRYNNIQIDGAVNNDVFGLADSGTPGGPAGTQPVSIDAIQELQLVVSPVDVRQAGFSGGGVNAITKSGSNAFKGSAFYYFRDQSLVGDGVDKRPIATFNDKQFGATLGGPLMKNKAFFFAAVDLGRRDTPSGYSISGSSGVSFGRQAEAQRFLEILQRRYGYNPGGLDEFIRKTNSDKILVKTDFNIGRNQLTLRHNYVDAFSDVGFQSATAYNFPDNFYRFNSKTNTTVGQFNSTFGTMFNEFRVTLQTIRDNRTTDSDFPQVTVRLPGGARFEAGTENFSTANELDQDVWEVTNDLTWVKGQHTFVIGTHNEFFKFRNLFIRDNNGSYVFEGLDNLEAGFAQQYDYSFSLTGDPQFPARFSVRQLGFYAGDQWRAANNFTLSYGIRFDTPIFPDKPTANPQSVALYGYATDVVPEDYTVSPRAGFNWDLTGTGQRQQLRGSIGYFGGRTPYVWLSNQYGNTGIEFRRVSQSFNVNNRIAFVADPDNQPTTVGGAASNEIDVIDPDYSYPKTIRGNLAYDRGLPLGLVGSVELLFSKSAKDIDYQNINLRQTGTRPDGRPVYGRLNTSFSDVILLTTTGEGDSMNIATKIDRPFRNGWMASGSYMFGRSRSVNDGGSSQARSNWINTYSPGDINNVPLATSNFDPRHRVTLSGSYQIDLRRARLMASLYYNGQSGRPYAYAYNSDVNGDGGFGNDLLYIPMPGEATFTNGTYDDLIAFINAGDCTDAGVTPGSIVERNSCRGPWTNSMDFRLALDVPIQRVETQITMDLQNLLNLFDSGNGLVQYATFNQLQPVNATVNAATNRYNYSINTVARPGGVRFSRDDLRSRWQAQIGLRVRF
ncbi:MAG: carboxypeptidase regulatory-like domain-containing protein [Vicinamibacterales bacterium]